MIKIKGEIAMKKLIYKAMGALLLAGMMTGCGASNSAASAEGTSPEASTQASVEAAPASGFDTSSEISVVSREDGSGTRGAFIELFGVEEKDADGNKVDHTTDEAMITNSTSVMMTTVAGDEYAIGYVSLGCLNDTVKAVDIDGVEATADNIKNDSYKISRPFNIATKGDVSEVANDFIQYILGNDGQKIVEDNGYISQGSQGEYTSAQPSGKIVVAGSSSVTPVMEKLKEAYAQVNPNAEIEIQESDSTTGMTSVMEGICDIGMASRELKDSEVEGGLTATVIALDGIAVVVNNDNPVEEMSSEAVKEVYTGEVTTWEEATK